LFEAGAVRVTRRRFVLFAAGVGAACGLGALAELASRELGGVSLLDVPEELRDPGTSAARRVGAAWLRAHPEEASRAALEGLLAPLPAGVHAASLRAAELHDWLRERQRAEFRAGRLVQLEGWWLSPTEVRLCAWLALAP
jgi:hypothetical protein